jgi:hypothetical protein
MIVFIHLGGDLVELFRRVLAGRSMHWIHTRAAQSGSKLEPLAAAQIVNAIAAVVDAGGWDVSVAKRPVDLPPRHGARRPLSHRDADGSVTDIHRFQQIRLAWSASSLGVTVRNVTSGSRVRRQPWSWLSCSLRPRSATPRLRSAHRWNR